MVSFILLGSGGSHLSYLLTPNTQSRRNNIDIRTTVNNGRIIYLKPDKCDLTAEEFLSYMYEGFMPVIISEGESVQFTIASYQISDDGIAVKSGDTTLYTLAYKNKSAGGGGDAEVWLVGDTGESGMFTLSNVGDIDRMAELFTNGENYQVFANSEALPYYTAPTMGGGALWKDNATEQTSTILLGIEQSENDEYSAVLYYLDASTAPTSVEVSVKAK